MRIVLEIATDDDAAAIAALRLAVARDLQARFGNGMWAAANDTAAGVRHEIRMSETHVVRDEETVIAALRLTSRNPWLGGTRVFTAAECPLYLIAMVVAPGWQRRGIGRECIEEIKRVAAGQRAGAIRLDAFDAPAGAGEFYRKCGFREVHRGPYHGTPLIWFELMLQRSQESPG